MTAFGSTPIFIDIGANIGENCGAWLKKEPSAQIYAFEAHPVLFKRLKARFEDRPNVKVFQMVVGLEDKRQVDYHLANNPTSSSLLPFNRENIWKWKYPPGCTAFRTVETIKVPMVRLDTVIRQQKIQYVDFLRIKAQGCDLSVMKSLGKSITRVREAVIEVSLTKFDIYKGLTNKKVDVEGFMSENRFIKYTSEKTSKDQEMNMWFQNIKYGKMDRNEFYTFGASR